METIERKSTARGMQLLGVLVIVCLCGIALVPAVAATVPSASTASDLWSGTWNTGASTPVASQTIGVLTLTGPVHR